MLKLLKPIWKTSFLDEQRLRYRAKFYMLRKNTSSSKGGDELRLTKPICFQVFLNIAFPMYQKQP